MNLNSKYRYCGVLWMILIMAAASDSCPSFTGTQTTQSTSDQTLGYYKGVPLSSLSQVIQGSSGTYLFGNLANNTQIMIKDSGTTSLGEISYVSGTSPYQGTSWILDNAENYIYFVDEYLGSTQIQIVRVTTNGAPETSFRTTAVNLDGMSVNLQISDDDSTLYIPAKSGSNYYICYYVMPPSNPTTPSIRCLKTGTTAIYYQLEIGNNKVLLFDSNSFKAQVRKVDIIAETQDWAIEISCPTFPSCSISLIGRIKAVTNIDKSIAYISILVGSGSKTLQMTAINTSDGQRQFTVATSTTCTSLKEMTFNNNKVYMMATCTGTTLLIYDTSTNNLTGAYTLNDSVMAISTISKGTLFGGVFDSSFPSIVQVSDNGLSDSKIFQVSDIKITNADTDYVISTVSPTFADSKANFSFTNSTSLTQHTFSATKGTITLIGSTNSTIILSQSPKTPLNESWPLSCTINSQSYPLSFSHSSSLPSWVHLNPQTGTLTGTAPLLRDMSDEQRTFMFYELANMTEAPYASYAKLVTIKVEDEEVSNTGKGATVGSQVASTIAAAITAVTSVSSGSSPSALWMLLNQLQLIITILLIDSFTPKDVDYYLEGTDFSLMNFDFLSTEKIPGIKSVADWMDAAQPFRKLELIGYETRSALINNLSFCAIMLFILTGHYFMKYVLRVPKWCKSKRCMLTNTCLISFLIRLVLEAHESFLLTSVSEIYKLDFSKGAYVLSILIAFLLFLFCLLIILAAILFFQKLRHNQDPERKFWFAEAFNEVKETNLCRLYPILLLSRRTIFTLVAIFLTHTAREAQYTLLILFQLLYLSYIACVRPYDKVHLNLIEFVNELFIVAIILMLLALNNSSKWDSTSTGIFVNILFSNTIIILLIKIIFDFSKFLISRLKKKKQKETRSDRYLDNQNNITRPTCNPYLESYTPRNLRKSQ
ncbi:unnamed protein product [Moneuplotes crassus]|uniref:TRP C-terminal domain-containing protein n=1 Tax=Euplotes crassus TaxID=5936 RepID=A0AAD1X5W4_EUPCR|nr:unnamed protein product [Moneuplotes crassus]